jgi:hypothetical protein
MGTKVVAQRAEAQAYDRTAFDAHGDPIVNRHAGNIYTWNDVKSGIGVAGYHEKIRACTSAGSPYTVRAKTYREGSGSAFVERTLTFFGQPKVVIEKIDGDLLLPPDASPNISYFANDYNSFVNDAKLQFLLACRQKQTKFDGLTFLGEIREAVHLVRHSATAIKDALDFSLQYYQNQFGKRRRRSGRYRPVKLPDIRNMWLELQFGWFPVVSDAQNAARALSEAMNKFSRNVEPVTRSFKLNLSTPPMLLNENYTIPGSNLSGPLTQWVECEFNAKLSAAVLVRTGQSGTSVNANLWGFSLREWLPTMYELVPWSWALDYVSNLGSVISAASFGLAELAWVCMTLTRSYKSFSAWLPGGALLQGLSGYRRHGGSGCISSYETFELDRTPDFGQLPTLQWSDKFKSPRRIANLASALSLHKSLVGGLH